MANRNFAPETKRAGAPTPRASSREVSSSGRDLVQHLREYARDNPEIAAAWCLGIGFVLGWRLKPW
jgi:hypothetical protein